MPPQNILISLRFAPLHQDILHRWLDKRQYSIYTEKGKRANEQPLLPQSHFSAVDCFYRVFFAEPENLKIKRGFPDVTSLRNIKLVSKTVFAHNAIAAQPEQNIQAAAF